MLREWDAALAALLAAEELDGLATALYTVGAPVRIDALFDAYSAAAGGAGQPAGSGPDAPAAERPDPDPAQAAAISPTRRRPCRTRWRRWPTSAWSSSAPRRTPAA